MRPYGVTLTVLNRWPTPAPLIAFTTGRLLTAQVTSRLSLPAQRSSRTTGKLLIRE